MISPQQQDRLNNSYRGIQDKKFTHLIHIDTGVLYPNVPRLKKHAKMRVFTGDKNLPPEQRLAHLDASLHTARPKVVNSLAEADAFDVGKASRDELIAFAATEYAFPLDPSMTLKAMRQAIVNLANAEAAGASSPDPDLT